MNKQLLQLSQRQKCIFNLNINGECVKLQFHKELLFLFKMPGNYHLIFNLPEILQIM